MSDSYEKVESILEIKKATILDVLRAVSANNTNKIIEWVKRLSANEYANLVKELADKAVSLIANIPFIRCSDGEVRSITGIRDTEDIVFLTSNLKDLKPVFDKLALKYTDISLGKLPEPYESKNITKVVVLLNDSTISDHYDKWTVFDVCKSINQVPNLKIFENQIGEKRPLSLLLHNSSNIVSSGVLKRFAIKPCEFDVYQRRMNVFMMPHEKIWEEIVDNWNLHVTKDLPYEVLIKDLNIIFSKKATNHKESSNSWIRTDTGEWAKSSEIFFCLPLSKMSENEYHYHTLVEFVKKATSLKIVPIGDVKFIANIRFSEIPNFNFKKLHDEFNHASISVTKQELEVLKKINSDSLLGSFVIQNIENGVYRLLLKERKYKQYFSENDDLNAFLKNEQDYFLLPSELESLFKNDTFLEKEDANFARDLIDKFGAEPLLFDLINKLPSLDNKSLFVQRINPLEFYTTDLIESYRGTFEAKVISLAKTLRLTDFIKTKISIDGKKLSHYDKRELVDVKIQTSFANFQLSELLPQYIGTSDVLSKIKDKMPSDAQWVFFAEKYKNSSIEQELITDFKILAKPEQFAFLIAFYNSDEGLPFKNRFSHFVFTQLNELDVLTSLTKEKRNFYFYYNGNLPSNWFNPKKYIDCDDENLILDSEKIPTYIRDWVSSDTERKDFFYKAGLINEQNETIALRKGILEDLKIKTVKIEEIFVLNTFEWISQKLNGKTFLRSSETAKNILQFIKEFSVSKQTLPSTLVSTIDLENYQIVEATDKLNMLYLDYNSRIDEVMFKDTLKNHSYLKIIINDGFKTILEKNGIKQLEFKGEFCSDTGDFKEWSDDFYDEWKKSDGEKYRIYVSGKEIPFKYSFEWNNQKKEVGIYQKGDTQRHKNKDLVEIYLQEKYAGEDLFFLLNDNMQKLFDNDAHLMGKLMNLRLKGLVPMNSKDGSSQINGTDGNGGNVTVVEDKKEIINEIKDLDIEILNRLKELGDKILKFNVSDLELISESDLEQLKQEKEKEEKSTPSELIGRIGEELAMKWLGERGLYPEHVAVTQDEYAYDILVHKDETGIERYIDVKTTTKSVIENDASVPLHIHKNAMKFLEAEADRNYFIIRISMGDLGIAHWNTQLKDRFNFRGKDRKLNDELIEAIRVKVNGFWEKPKNQKLFEKTVKEFRLTIPKMVLAEMEN